MLSGSILLSCLLLAADNGASEEPTYLNNPKFEIPLRIDKEKRHEIREVVLYAATPTRENPQPQFRRVGSVTPDKAGFPYTANDGQYWFTVQVVYKNGKLEPATPSEKGALKVIVDTTRPDIRLSAERIGDMIVARWELSEDNPDKPTLRLDYQTAEMAPNNMWTPLGIERDRRGEYKFYPPGTSQIKVVMTLRDLAGNEGRAEVIIPAAVSPGPIPSGVQQPVSPVWPPGAISVQKQTDPLPPPPPSQPLVSQYQPPFGPGAVTTVSANPSGPPGIGGALVGGSGSLVPLTVVSRTHVKVEFDVTRCGPSGLGSADVWLMADDGQGWQKTQSDEPLLLPQGDLPLGGPIKAGVMVKIPQPEVIYGIYLVVKSKAGVGLPPPQRNTAPQMRVELDTKSPEATLRLPPMPKPGFDNVLIFSWLAQDRNLEATPITLEYAELPTGPWKLIGPPQIPNTGHFEWQVPNDIPGKVFLRMTVRDQAGNASVAVTKEAVPVDTTPPIPSDFRVVNRLGSN